MPPTSGIAAACDLPVHQPQSIDVSTFEGVKVAHVDTFIQHFWSHVPETQNQTVQKHKEHFVQKKAKKPPNVRSLCLCVGGLCVWAVCVCGLCVCLPLGAHALVGSNVDSICDRLMAHCEAQISNGTREILFYQNVLRF